MKKFRTSIFFSIPFLFIVFSLLWYREGTLPVNTVKKENMVFVVRQGETVAQIARNLENANFIRNRIVFYLTVKRLGIEKSIQAGTFRLSPSMNAKEVATELTHGTEDTWVTIIEGLRKEEVAAIVVDKIGISAPVFVSEAPEGYLFPDTYLMPKDATAKQIIEIMKKTFDTKVTDDIRKAASQRGLTLDELVTFASLLEREARSYEEKRMIAGILFNRLNEGKPLQVDATVQYALGYDDKSKTWWKRNLSYDDLKIDSPYNTYVNVGLPPSPIANPGVDSLLAVAYPKESNYQFYITGDDGVMRYSTTYEEHLDKVDKHIQ
ncbi:MAG: endolytic transglycosylase MltG [Candidatus Roizmanbacteria bacterium]|nr:endolytic transglycosylase MltG [Candidatus Roizmanbacteria bacterium]